RTEPRCRRSNPAISSTNVGQGVLSSCEVAIRSIAAIIPECSSASKCGFGQSFADFIQFLRGVPVNASLTRYFSRDVMSFTINSEASGEKGTKRRQYGRADQVDRQMSSPARSRRCGGEHQCELFYLSLGLLQALQDPSEKRSAAARANGARSGGPVTPKVKRDPRRTRANTDCSSISCSCA